jgi:hypothetical protein
VFPARRRATNGLEAWAEVLARGYEGLVAKDLAAPYVGGRTLKWLKVKQPATARASAGGNRRINRRLVRSQAPSAVGATSGNLNVALRVTLSTTTAPAPASL